MRAKILICEDDLDILEMMRILVTDLGFSAQTCTKSKNVLSSILEYGPNLIVLDYWLNETKGDEVISKIKADNALKKIPIMVVSAIANLDEVSKRLPIEDTLKKPFDIQDFKSKIKRLLKYNYA